MGVEGVGPKQADYFYVYQALFVRWQTYKWMADVGLSIWDEAS